MAAHSNAARLRANPGWAIAALLLGLALTALAVWQRLDTNQQQLDEAVAQQANLIADRVVERLTLYQYGLRSLRGLWHTVGIDALGPGQFAAYNSTRNVAVEFPGALSFGIVRKVGAEQVTEFTRQAVAAGDSHFAVHGFAPHDGDLYVIRYIDPPGPKNMAQGLDIASEPNRRKAADDALLSGEAQLTGAVTLVQSEGEVRRGFLMVMPVYRTPRPPATDAQRREQGVGWTYVSLLIKDVLGELNRHSAGTLLEIKDITDAAPTAPFYVQAAAAPSTPALASYRTERQLFGRTWQLTLDVYPDFVRQLHPTAPGLILALGLLSSLLLALVVQLVRQRLLRGITEQKAFNAKAQRLTQVLETEVNQRTQALQSLDLLLKNILDAATGVSIIVTDPNRIIRVFNRGAERAGLPRRRSDRPLHPELMHDPEELRAQNQQMAARYGGEFSGIDGYVAQTRNEAEPSVFQCHYRRKDGSYLLVHLVVTVMRDHTQAISGYLGFAIDVSAQRELEINLQQAKVEADKANMAKSAFLASMSHEIRTPMNAVLGMLQLAAQSGLNADQQDFVSRAHTAATLLLGLLNDILDYSKIEAGKLQVDEHPFNLETLLRDLGVVLSGNQPPSGVELIFDIDPRLSQGLVGDSLRLQQVLINLAGNALKFTEAGQVVISVRQLRSSASHVTLEFAVTDSGIGMSTEQLARIFQAFSQGDASTARKFGGSGLGLLICKRLTDLMGSDLRVESEPGLGTRFWFELALAIDPAQAPATAPAPLKVLVVDDNALAGAILKRNLQGLGWTAMRITRCSDLAAQGFDVLVVDWRVLEQQPQQAFTPLRGVAPLVLLVTAFTRDAATQALQAAGLPPPLLLTKPLTPRQLARHLADLRPAGTPAPAKPTGAPSRPKRLAGLRLLLVEDNAVNQMVAAGLLKAEGASVELADCGVTGVERALHAQPPYDLVLMDLRMPDIDGQEATRRIRQVITADRLPIIAMTANVSEQDREQCLAAGMNEHVGKPINLERLVEVIQRFHTPR